MSNTRLKPQWLRVTDAPDAFQVEVTKYGISTEGKYGESDYIECVLDRLPRWIRLNQKSLMYLATHGFDVSEKALKKELPTHKLRFEKQKIGTFQALVVVAVIAKKGGKKA